MLVYILFDVLSFDNFIVEEFCYFYLKWKFNLSEHKLKIPLNKKKRDKSNLIMVYNSMWGIFYFLTSQIEEKKGNILFPQINTLLMVLIATISS